MTSPHPTLLISGASGTGKSTIALHVAERLGISHVVSTDVVRGVMRSVIPEVVAPALHADSFLVPEVEGLPDDDSEQAGVNLAGYLEQARIVRAGVDAAIVQMQREDTGLVVEGVHILPDVHTRLEDELHIPIVLLAALDERSHRDHFVARNADTAGKRPPERYLRNFHRIREVQDHLVERARDVGVPVIDTTSGDELNVADQVLAALLEL